MWREIEREELSRVTARAALRAGLRLVLQGERARHAQPHRCMPASRRLDTGVHVFGERGVRWKGSQGCDCVTACSHAFGSHPMWLWLWCSGVDETTPVVTTVCSNYLRESEPTRMKPAMLTSSYAVGTLCSSSIRTSRRRSSPRTTFWLRTAPIRHTAARSSSRSRCVHRASLALATFKYDGRGEVQVAPAALLIVHRSHVISCESRLGRDSSRRRKRARASTSWAAATTSWTGRMPRTSRRLTFLRPIDCSKLRTKLVERSLSLSLSLAFVLDALHCSS